MGERGPLKDVLSQVGQAHLPLVVLSLACAIGLIVAELVDSSAVGGPVGLFIAALFLLNGIARLWLRQRMGTLQNPR